MAQLTLYIDTTSNTLITGQTSAVPIAPTALQLFFGDTIQLQVFLFNKPASSSAPSIGQFPFSILPTSGLTLYFYLDDGTISGTIYTQQISWTASADGTYFTANLSLNTAALQALIGANTEASCWIKIGYVQGGLPTTVYSQKVTVKVGLPSLSAPSVPAGFTALSVEVGGQLFIPAQPVAGQPILIMSAAGKIIALAAVDQPDGTASFAPSNIN